MGASTASDASTAAAARIVFATPPAAYQRVPTNSAVNFLAAESSFGASLEGCGPLELSEPALLLHHQQAHHSGTRNRSTSGFMGGSTTSLSLESGVAPASVRPPQEYSSGSGGGSGGGGAQLNSSRSFAMASSSLHGGGASMSYVFATAEAMMLANSISPSQQGLAIAGAAAASQSCTSITTTAAVGAPPAAARLRDSSPLRDDVPAMAAASTSNDLIALQLATFSSIAGRSIPDAPLFDVTNSPPRSPLALSNQIMQAAAAASSTSAAESHAFLELRGEKVLTPIPDFIESLEPEAFPVDAADPRVQAERQHAAPPVSTGAANSSASSTSTTTFFVVPAYPTSAVEGDVGGLPSASDGDSNASSGRGGAAADTGRQSSRADAINAAAAVVCRAISPGASPHGDLVSFMAAQQLPAAHLQGFGYPVDRPEEVSIIDFSASLPPAAAARRL